MFLSQRDGLRQAMLLTVMKRQCYIYTYRNLCVCICGGWGGKREQNVRIQLISLTSTGMSPVDIHTSGQQKICYRLEWHIISFAFALPLHVPPPPTPPTPAHSSSPSTELRVRLCWSLVSTRRLTAKMLIFHVTPSVVLAFCFPCMATHYPPFSCELSSLLSLSQPVLHLQLLSQLPMALFTLAKTAIPPQWCGGTDTPVHWVTSSSFSSHFSKASFTGNSSLLLPSSTPSALTYGIIGWTSCPCGKWPPCSAGKSSFSLTFPHQCPRLCYSPV